MIVNLARTQREQGHDVSFCGFGPGGLDAAAREYGIRVHCFSTRSRWSLLPPGLTEFLRYGSFDIVHIHWGLWLRMSVACAIAGVPCVHTYHGGESRRHCLAHRIAGMLTARVILPSPDVPPYITRYVGVPRERLLTVWNGIDIDQFVSADAALLPGIPDGANVVGMVARMSVPKDYATFIRACALLHRSHPELHFAAVGDGPQRTSLNELVDEFGLRDRFWFLGVRSDIASIMRRLSVLVLSSRSESMGLTLVEAMAAGCVAVGSDIPAIRWLLEDGRAGMLFQVGNAEHLMKNIATVLDNVDIRKALVEGGRRRAGEFTRQRMAQQYVKIYQKCIRTGSREARSLGSAV